MLLTEEQVRAEKCCLSLERLEPYGWTVSFIQKCLSWLTICHTLSYVLRIQQ